MISRDKTYRTRNGLEVRIYATDGGGRMPIQGAIKRETGWRSYDWNKKGMFSAKESIYDLVEFNPTVKRTVWLNLYEDCTSSWSTKELADKYANNRFACVAIEVECERGQGI